MPAATSSRWCPTPEHLMILEEMYRSGIRTPNASQIQQITAHLSFYGKIEGKNVFYWFQNHKARDRQRLRRKLSKQLHHQQLLQQQLYHQQHFFHNQINNYHHTQSHHLFHYLNFPIPASPTALHHQLSHPTSALHLYQGGCLDASMQTMTSTWNMGDVEMEKRSNGLDWKMTKDQVSQASSPCCDRPLKTLELFPVTSTTSLKDKDDPNIKSDLHISSSCFTNY